MNAQNEADTIIVENILSADKLAEAPIVVEGIGADTWTWISGNVAGVASAVLVGAALVLVLLGVKTLAARMIAHGKLRNDWATIISRTIVKTRLWFLILLAFHVMVGMTSAPPLLSRTAEILFTIAAALQGAIWVRQLILGTVEHRAGSDPDHTLGSAMGLIRVLVSFAVFAIAFTLILDNIGVNVTGLVAGLGIGGIAIGLAAQGIFSDLFSALAIIFDKPFKVGDTVTWDQTTGVVEQIGLKSTRLRASTGEQIVVANAQLLGKELRNVTRFRHRRFQLAIGVTYQTPPEVCEQIPGIITDIIGAYPQCVFSRCVMKGFGASSLDFDVLYDLAEQDDVDLFQINSAICITILKQFNARGIDFAYPSQTTFTAAPDGRLIMPYAVAEVDSRSGAPLPASAT